jgi:hypothetical protein
VAGFEPAKEAMTKPQARSEKPSEKVVQFRLPNTAVDLSPELLKLKADVYAAALVDRFTLPRLRDSMIRLCELTVGRPKNVDPAETWVKKNGLNPTEIFETAFLVLTREMAKGGKVHDPIGCVETVLAEQIEDRAREVQAHHAQRATT